MNLSIKLLSATAFAVTALSLASCQEEDFGFDAEKIAYYDHFVQAFGKADPNQDWNLVRQLAEQNARTRAYSSDIPGITIANVPEAEWITFGFDEATYYRKMLPEQTNGVGSWDNTNLDKVTQNFLVTTSTLTLYPEYWCTNGSNEIGIYYYVPEGTTDATTVKRIIGTDEYGNPVYENDYIMRVPICAGKPSELEKGTKSPDVFKTVGSVQDIGGIEGYWENLVATGKFKLATANEYDIYGNKPFNEGDQLCYYGKSSQQYDTSAGVAGTEWDAWIKINQYPFNFATDLFPVLVTIKPELFKVAEGGEYYDVNGYNKATKGAQIMLNAAGAFQGYSPVGSVTDVASVFDDESVTDLRSKGIKITFDNPMTIGMYCMQGSYCMYSEADLNYLQRDSNNEQRLACHVGTYISDHTDEDGNAIRYLGFEDWYGEVNNDLNDIIFRVYGFDSPGSTIIDKDIVTEEEIIEEGLLVCEDLGDFDFDFNDIVLKLTHYGKIKTTIPGGGGEPTIEYLNNRFEIQAMAAGGTLESYIKYNNNYIGSSQANSGIHVLLGGTAPDIINAGLSMTNTGQKISFTIPSVSDSETAVGTWNKTDYPNGYVDQVFANGYITIEVENGTIIQKIASVSNTGDLAVSANVPQMMLLPVSFLWPQELQTIGTKGTITGVYPEFNQWVTNSGNTSWINTHDTRVTSR